MPFFSARPTAIFTIRARGRLPFLFRQILTAGYVNAGYRNTVTWRNVNTINNATDVTTNLGDLLQFGTSYMAGAHTRNHAYVFGTNGSGTEGWGGFTTTSCFNMRNNTTLTRNAAMDTPTAVGHSHTHLQQDGDGNYTFGYLTGANSTNLIRRFNMVTETLDATTWATTYPNINAVTSWSGEGSSGQTDETFGIWYNDANRLKFTFATQTQSTPSANPASSSQQRGISSKLGFGWAGNEGSYNGGNSFRKNNLTTDVISSTMAKPITNSGEENHTLGQTHSYMLGMYNGAQLNRSWRWNYATDSGFEGGASMQPSGTATGVGVGGANHPEALIQGRSSAVQSWRD